MRPSDLPAELLSDRERQIVLAIGQTMFPRDTVIGIDADDADILPWVDDYLGRMPALGRNQIRALLSTFDLGYAAWAGRPRDTFRGARPADRAAYLESWERSTSYTQRMLYEAIRALLTFAYVDSRAVDELIRPNLPEEVEPSRVAAASGAALAPHDGPVRAAEEA